jgi:hypothetical protein
MRKVEEYQYNYLEHILRTSTNRIPRKLDEYQSIKKNKREVEGAVGHQIGGRIDWFNPKMVSRKRA